MSRKSTPALALLVGLGVAAGFGLAFAREAEARALPTISREQATKDAVALFRRYGGEALANAGRAYMDVLMRAEAGEATTEELQQATYELGAAMEPLTERQREDLITEAMQMAKKRKVQQP